MAAISVEKKTFEGNLEVVMAGLESFDKTMVARNRIAARTAPILVHAPNVEATTAVEMAAAQVC